MLVVVAVVVVVVVAVVERDQGLMRGSKGTWLEADMVALLWWWCTGEWR